MSADYRENPYAGLGYYFATQNPLKLQQGQDTSLTSILQGNAPQQTAPMTGNTGVVKAPSTTPKGFNYRVAASSAKTQYDTSVAAAEEQRDKEIKAINDNYDSQLSVLNTDAKGSAEAARLEEQRNKKIEKAKASCENKKQKAGKTFQSTMNTVKTWGGLKDEDIQKDENLKAAFDEYKKQTEPQQTEEQAGAKGGADATSASSGETSSSGSGTSTTSSTTTTKKTEEEKDGEKKGSGDLNLAEGTAELVGSGIGEGVFSSIAKWSKEKSGMGKQGDPMGRDAHLNRQAEMHDNESAEHRMDQQRWSQIANQDPRREAGKDALAKAAVQNEQKVHNMGNASAGAAALERGEADADPNALRNRGDQARMKATENMEKANDENQTAEQERAGADVYGYTARDMETSNAQAKAITDGGAADGETETKTEEKEKPKDVEEKEEDTPQVSPQSWQAYISYICYGADPTSKNCEQSKTFDPKIRELAKPLIKKYGLEPIKPSDLAAKYQKGSQEYNVLFGNGSTGQFADWTGNGNMRARQQSILQAEMEDMYKDSPMIKDWKSSGSHTDANGKQVNRAEGALLSEEEKKAEEQKKMINDVTSKSEVPQ